MEKILEKLKTTHPIIEKLLEYRQIGRLNSTYVEGLIPYINPKTQRIHSYFHQTITATGNAFDVELEIKHLDENPGQKTTQAEVTKIGENIYYNEYTSQIMEELEDKGYIRLKEGDMFSTTVKNTNTTIAQQLRGFFYKIAGNENAQVAAKHGGVVSVNGSGN